jgi:hypothetical protein
VLNPVLGSGSKFFVRTYKNYNVVKPFMFIDGCPANLGLKEIYVFLIDFSKGCTILLRGGSREILKNLKKVTLVNIFFKIKITFHCLPHILHITCILRHNSYMMNIVLFQQSVFQVSYLRLIKIFFFLFVYRNKGSSTESKIILSFSPNVNFPTPTTPNGPPSLYLPSNRDEDPLSPFNEPEDEEVVNPFAVVADYQFDRQRLDVPEG